MHYYNHNIADYRKDTGHLSLLEHGIYRQLLDAYYLYEQPIPRETEVVFRRLCARTEEERKATETVLDEFFSLGDAGWIHSRCDKEIAAYQGKAERAREAGKLGGRPKKTEEVISGFSKETEEKANLRTKELNNSLTQETKEKKETVSPIGFTEFWTAYPSHPRKGGKDKCLKIWVSKKLESKASQILAHLAWQKKDWARSNNDYVQMPASYLNAAKWDGWIDMGEQVKERGMVF